MALFQGVFFLVLGVGIVLIVYRSPSRGWLPMGPKGIAGRLEIRRDRAWLLFWALYLLYGAVGLWMLSFALRLFMGTVEPLPLR